MGATADNLTPSYSAKLADFAGTLRDHVRDESMLREIHGAIKTMLAADRVSEKEIRTALQRQYDAGKLRRESYELVRALLDRIVLDDDGAAPAADTGFTSTTVIDEPVELDASGNAGFRLQPGTVLRERYLLQKELPGGSMGTVFKALDRRLAEADSGDHWVAIKVLAPKLAQHGNALRALQQEAAKMRCLSHPNIVRFIDLDREDQLYFMVMEWLEGKTLARILDDSSRKKIDLEMALDIVSQVGRALEYAHQRGVVHADVKPANIMVTPSGQVKLFDFGIARIRQKQDDRKDAFDPAVLNAASPAYSSMQVLTGEDPVPADDVFSLACLAYRLIAGYRVFGPRNAAEAAEAGMEPQPIESLSKAQWKALRKALSFSRVTRFASPAAFVDALVHDRKIVGDHDETAYNERLDHPRTPWRAVGLFVIFLAAAAVVFQSDLRELWQLDRGASGLSAEGNKPLDTAGSERPSDGVTGAARPQAAGAAVADSSERDGSGVPGDAPAAARADTQGAQPVQAATVDSGDQDGNVDGAGMVDTLAEEGAAALETASAEAAVEIESAAPPAVPKAADAAPKPLDFSTLPPPGAEIHLDALGQNPRRSGLVVMEDAGALIIDFVRAEPLADPLYLQLAEESVNGNRSAWVAGQYSISNGGRLEFPAGQARARSIITMSSDPVREPDREVQLVLRDAEYQDIHYGRFRITLQDDDQRAFERGLQPNTVAFAVSQVSVGEYEAAVQIDVLRYKPDDSSLSAAYTVRDVTASQGEDYVDPGDSVVRFEPGQRSARIIIPLVQDTEVEGDEAFMLELSDESGDNQSNIYRRIAVMIRDDDT